MGSVSCVSLIVPPLRKVRDDDLEGFARAWLFRHLLKTAKLSNRISRSTLQLFESIASDLTLHTIASATSASISEFGPPS